MPCARCQYVILLFTLFLPAAVGAFPADAEDLLARGGYTSEEEGRIRDVFDDAAAAGVPNEFLVPRLAEGVSKGVSPERLAAALTRRLDTLLRARRHLIAHGYRVETPAGRSLWNRAALLLWDGAPDYHLARLLDASRGRRESFEEVVPLYASLVGWGLSREEVMAVSEHAVGSALPPQDYPGLVAVLAEARRQRIPVSDAVRRLTEALTAASSLDQVREEVLY